jgi:acetyltransferase
MGTRSLEQIFKPKSVAVIGASDRGGSLGGAVLKSILKGGFEGSVFPVNAKDYKQIAGIAAFAKVSHINQAIDLAIICTPADTVPKIIRSLEKARVSAAIIMTGGSARTRSIRFRPSTSKLNAVGKDYGIRILGPDCLGMLNLHHKFNASVLPAPVKPGSIAFIGQSGAIASGITDWAASRGIGFSHVLTLGQGSDISLADVVDYLADDRHARTLLIQLDDFNHGSDLLRSLRAASRKKLVLAVKSNRFPQSPLANDDHTPGIRNRDALIDHALQRAGVLRVDATDDLFDCVDTLQQRRSLKGDRLAIVTNSRGGAILAVDRLLHDHGVLADFSAETTKSLSEMLPDYISCSNPVLLNPELKPDLLKKVCAAVLKDKGVDALLFVYTPGMGTDPLVNASALAEVSANTSKMIFSCWMGEYSVGSARELLYKQQMPTFDTPDNAIKAFMYQVKHLRTQELMRETPDSYEVPGTAQADVMRDLPTKGVISPNLAWRLIKSFGFATADNRFFTNRDEMIRSAGEIKGSWVAKIHHEQYLKPFAYGQDARQRWKSVALNITNKQQLMDETQRLQAEVSSMFPDSRILGFSMQPMYRAMDNLQISFGIGRDKEVGPFIFFGGGGTTADILTDRRVALPPLNTALARHLIERSHVSRVLKEKTHNYDLEVAALSRWLVAAAQLCTQYPQISGLEMNAVRRDDGQYMVLGVAGETDKPKSPAIRAYPTELEEVLHNKHGERFLVRPIKAEDEHQLAVFYKALSPETLRMRFFTSRKNFDHKELAHFSQIDYCREMAFVALHEGELVGIVRAWIDPDDIVAEYSVLVRDDFAGHQLGYLLMDKMIRYLREDRKVLQVMGTVLSHNNPMLRLNDRLGFVRKENKAEGLTEVILPLNPPAYEWQKKRMYSL